MGYVELITKVKFDDRKTVRRGNRNMRSFLIWNNPFLCYI